MYLQARGVKPPPTKEELAQYAANERYILDQQMKAHNRVVEERKKPRKKKCIASAANNAAALKERMAAGIKDHD